MQFQLAGERQTALSHHPPLALAEVPSTFAEMIVTDRLLAAGRRSVGAARPARGSVETAFATVFRQTLMVRYEQSAYGLRAEGKALMPERLDDLWIDANAPYYGDAVEMPEGYRFGWAYIPHFIHTRFYTYAYVFAHLASLALSAQVPRGRRRVRRPVPRLPLDRRRSLPAGAARRASASTSPATTAGTRASPRSSA